jgi:hypothetical protein
MPLCGSTVGAGNSRWSGFDIHYSRDPRRALTGWSAGIHGSERTGRMLSRQLVLELAYWTPLVTLLLLSLGLIALERITGLSPWAKRLIWPPFYFISLPVATLVVGMEMLTWIVRFFLSGPPDVDSLTLFLGNLYVFLLMLAAFPLLAILGYGLFAALVFSGLTLGRVFLDEEDWKCPALETKRRLTAIVLLAAFVWAWVTIRYLIVDWETPLV